jgi:pimeloyl-ACP methyl ester carboxylesterase
MPRIFPWLGASVAALLVAAAAASRLAAPAEPDAFYRQPAGPAAQPGDVVAVAPFSRGVPEGATAMRVLYATTRADGSPATASAIVMTRSGLAQARGTIAWAHGTTGIAAGCAPSVMSDAFANVPAVRELLAEDWVYVATDYAGLGTAGGHAYLVGEEAARGVLDAVRASRRIGGFPTAPRVVVWGHSQGGGSSLWTAMRAGDYAPDVGLAGAAALAPASDLPALFTAAKDTLFGRIVSAYAIVAYGRTYPDVRPEDHLRGGVGWLVRDMAGRCVGEWPTLVSALQSALLSFVGMMATEPTAGALGTRLRENTPRGPFPVPLMIAQGEADDLVLPSIQRRYAVDACAGGATLRYVSYPGRDHLSLVAKDSPLTSDLITWTRARLEGAPAPGGCPSPTR